MLTYQLPLAKESQLKGGVRKGASARGAIRGRGEDKILSEREN